MSSLLRYKVIESSVVTDEALEAIINEWVRQGWTLDGIQFAMRESSKRPAMAFVMFTRRAEESAPRLVPLEEAAPPTDSKGT